MTVGRTRARRVLTVLGVGVLAGSLITASPGAAEPDIDEVQERVERLYHEAEVASERYNDVRLELEESRERLRTLRRNLERQRAHVEEIRDQVAANVVSDYQNASFSTAAQVFLSDDPDTFLSQLTTRAAYDEQQSELMAGFALEADRLTLRQEAAQRETEQIRRAKERLAEREAEIGEKAQAAQDLLNQLEAEERERLAAEREREARRASRAAERQALETAEQTEAPAAETPSAPAVSGRAEIAVNYALSQVGKSYVWGADGPDSFDCSGLTLMAWAQAGVSLPHSSGAQMSAGTPVSQSQLQPGDLVFYYSPVSHVGIYIGNGQIVDAANPSTGVRIAGVNSMPYSGAVRVG